MLKYRLILGTILIAMIVAISLLSFSGSSNSSHAAETAEKGSGLWCTMQLNGCKPAVGFMLLEEKGKVTEGHFFIVAMGDDANGKQSGIFTSMKLDYVSDNELKMTATVTPGEKPDVREYGLQLSKPESSTKRIAKFWEYNEKNEKGKVEEMVFTQLHQSK